MNDLTEAEMAAQWAKLEREVRAFNRELDAWYTTIAELTEALGGVLNSLADNLEQIAALGGGDDGQPERTGGSAGSADAGR